MQVDLNNYVITGHKGDFVIHVKTTPKEGKKKGQVVLVATYFFGTEEQVYRKLRTLAITDSEAKTLNDLIAVTKASNKAIKELIK